MATAHSTLAEAPDILFADEGVSRAALAKAVKEGRAVRLGPGIYTPRARAKPEDVVRRNWMQIVDHELPGAIITDRSARRAGPSNGVLTVVHSRKRPLVLPGLTIVPRPGLGPLPDDNRLLSLWVASDGRALLENLRSAHLRYLPQADIEDWLGDMLRHGGNERLNQARDQARMVASAHPEFTQAFKRLDRLIGAALSTQPADILVTDALRAQSSSEPYDRSRIELFDQLAQALVDVAVKPLPLLPADEARRTLLPFYEAYFSNYIEGTEFTLDEAADIVLEGKQRIDRPEDAHDVYSTYLLVSDPDQMQRTPGSADEFVAQLKEWHGRLMAPRADQRPGQFKDRDNQAGSTLFVPADLAEQTLRRAFQAGRDLIDPFARAIFMGFVVSEVHPFGDGNGRLSRVMMNADLSRANETRIIIPTVYRGNYLMALRGASHNRNFAGLVSALDFARRYTARIDFTNRQTAEADLTRTNALRDPNEADLAGVRLQMP